MIIPIKYLLEQMGKEDKTAQEIVKKEEELLNSNKVVQEQPQ